jgi:hypothetical protein
MGTAVSTIPRTLLGIPRASIANAISDLIFPAIGNLINDRFVLLTDAQKKHFSASISHIVRVEVIDWTGNGLARV